MRLENLIAPSGSLPIDTAGGNIAKGFVHCIGLVVEAARRIRGTGRIDLVLVLPAGQMMLIMFHRTSWPRLVRCRTIRADHEPR